MIAFHAQYLLKAFRKKFRSEETLNKEISKATQATRSQDRNSTLSALNKITEILFFCFQKPIL